MKETVRIIALAPGETESIKDARVAMLQKGTSKNPGAVEFPGGKVDGEESPLEAAQRELREEVGIDIPAFELQLLESFEYINTFNQVRTKVFVFLVLVPESQKIEINSDDDGHHSNGKWLSYYDIIDLSHHHEGDPAFLANNSNISDIRLWLRKITRFYFQQTTLKKG